ncbi:MAG: sigma-70 family RNA polymerase sigma factor [Pyrinomonadaceae bacterium]|nr:sigma-70 family RNA polymerase sigma factor [Pyrinomonadaceae bacterium]
MLSNWKSENDEFRAMREQAKTTILAMSGVTQETVTTNAKTQFDDAFTLYHRTVFRVARNFVGDFALAEDVTQEVFMRLYTNLNVVSQEDMLKAWLIRVTLNVAKNTVRGKSRTTKREENYFKEYEDLMVAEPELDFERQRQIEAVREALTKVKEPLRSCLTLKQEGLSYKEIAAALDLNETSVGTYVARGRKEFLRYYGKTN